MYIAPNSTIRLFHTIPLDPDYENTILFNSLSEQTAYFSSGSRIIASLGTQYYQRAERGYCRVKLPISKCLDCNYMAFKNTSFTELYQDKWFYAFVTSVEYINNEVTQIQYSIDEMQTYMFDVELLPSYVEREHIPLSEDDIGANITPEPMQLSEYVANGNDHNIVPSLTNNNDYCCLILLNDKDKSVASLHNMHCGIYSGLLLFAYFCSDRQGIQDMIDNFIATPENIVSMYFCPVELLPERPPVGGSIASHLIPSTTVFNIRTYNDSAVTPNDTLDGYKPRNNKMYTYPFNYYEVFTGDGNGITLRYEYFKELTPKFQLMGTYLQPVECRLNPVDYKNNGSLLTESITLSNFPQIAWAVDAFKHWIAKEWFPILINAMGIGVAAGSPILGEYGMGAIQSIMPDGKFGTTEGYLNKVTGDIVPVSRMGGYRQRNRYNAMNMGMGFAGSTLKDTYTASIQANMTKGSISGGSTSIACDIKGFFGLRFSVDSDCAKRVDDFLTRYGYATHQMKVPNRTGRTYFNYVKTSQVNIHVLPMHICQSDDIETLKNIYNKGITFWHDPSKCGMFTEEVMDNN